MLSEVMNQVTALLKFPSLIASLFEGCSYRSVSCQLGLLEAGKCLSSREFLREGRERALPCKCHPEVQKRYQETPLDSVIHKTFMKVNDCSVGIEAIIYMACQR